MQAQPATEGDISPTPESAVDLEAAEDLSLLLLRLRLRRLAKKRKDRPGGVHQRKR